MVARGGGEGEAKPSAFGFIFDADGMSDHLEDYIGAVGDADIHTHHDDDDDDENDATLHVDVNAICDDDGNAVDEICDDDGNAVDADDSIHAADDDGIDDGGGAIVGKCIA